MAIRGSITIDPDTGATTWATGRNMGQPADLLDATGGLLYTQGRWLVNAQNPFERVPLGTAGPSQVTIESDDRSMFYNSIQFGTLSGRGIATGQHGVGVEATLTDMAGNIVPVTELFAGGTGIGQGLVTAISRTRGERGMIPIPAWTGTFTELVDTMPAELLRSWEPLHFSTPEEIAYRGLMGVIQSKFKQFLTDALAAGGLEGGYQGTDSYYDLLVSAAEILMSSATALSSYEFTRAP